MKNQTLFKKIAIKIALSITICSAISTAICIALDLNVVLEIIVQIISIIVTTVLCARFVYQALQPLEELNNCMLEMSKGKLKTLPKYKSDDEFGKLSDSLRTTMTNLNIYVEEIKTNFISYSKGDFTHTSNTEFLGDFKDIQTHNEKFVTLITSTFDSLKSSVEIVSSSSSHVANGSNTLATGAVRQTQTVNTLNDSLESITQSLTDNVKSVEYINISSNTAAQQLSSSNAKMDDIVDAMKNIKSTSEDIRKVIATIEDVAFQTNILALNAAVEAARAGKAGQGFAIVADEVRNLATRTSKAIADTEKLIEQSENAVNVGYKLVNETSGSLDDTLAYVGSFIGELDTVTESSRNQAVVIEEINTGIREISEVMQSNSEIGLDSASTSEELTNQVSIMQKNINKFSM